MSEIRKEAIRKLDRAEYVYRALVKEVFFARGGQVIFGDPEPEGFAAFSTSRVHIMFAPDAEKLARELNMVIQSYRGDAIERAAKLVRDAKRDLDEHYK